MSIIIDGTGTISGVSATGLTTAQTVGYSSLPTGSVLQVVQGTSSTQTSSISTNFATTTLTASITPKFSTSKILVISSLAIQITNNSSSAGSGLAIYKNGSSVYSDPAPYASFYMGTVAGSNPRTRISLNYLDSPASTSSLAYTLYFNAFNGQNVVVNADGQTSFITLMEIAG